MTPSPAPAGRHASAGHPTPAGRHAPDGRRAPAGARGTGLRVVFLGSGSRGNAVAVTDGTTLVLVDCGFPEREVARRLRRAGLVAGRVSALVVTHEHSDHVCGAAAFARRHGCPVLATAGTLQATGLADARVELADLRAGREERIGGLTVLPFATAHDAAEPVGIRVEAADGTRFAHVTDTGHLTPEAAEALVGADILGLETNHDVEMLARGPYPAFLKRRIRSATGHLSNAEAAAALARVASDRLQRVFALHRSETNNTADLARLALETCLVGLGLAVPVEVAPQGDILDSSPPQPALFGT